MRLLEAFRFESDHIFTALATFDDSVTEAEVLTFMACAIGLAVWERLATNVSRCLGDRFELAAMTVKTEVSRAERVLITPLY